MRCERRAEMGMKQRGLSVFLPNVWVESLHLKRCYQRPLFPRYLFIGMDRPLFGAVRDTDGVERILVGSTGAPLQVPAAFLESLQRIQNGEEEGPEAATREKSLEPGEMVRIIEGPLTGLLAEIDESTGFVAEMTVNIMGRAMQVTLPIAALART